MTKTEGKPAIAAVKELFATSPDGLRELVRAVVQEMLERRVHLDPDLAARVALAAAEGVAFGQRAPRVGIDHAVKETPMPAICDLAPEEYRMLHLTPELDVGNVK